MFNRHSGWLMAAVVLSGCSRENVYVEPPPPEVTVTAPEVRDVTNYLEFSGLTQPVETVDIRARVRGFLQERHFTEGSEVHQGDLLLVIDEEPFQIQLDAARTQLKEAEAMLQQATVSRSREVAQAQVNLSESQVQLARQEEQRVRSLFQRQVSTQAELDQVLAAVKAREAELESARAHLAQAQATYETAILTARAQVQSAQIAVREAELNLSYCRMTAPIDGRISRSQVDVGNLVDGGGSQILATIVRLTPIYAYATIGETDLHQAPALRNLNRSSQESAAQELSVDLGLPDEVGFSMSGVIDYTDPGLDPSTGTLRIRAVFANSDRELLPGMYVRMRLPVSERDDALLVPERALGTDQSGQFVYVVDGAGKVQYTPVKTGPAIETLRVVEGAITPSDQVIVEGLLRVRPGARVRPVPLEPVAAESTSVAAAEPSAGGQHRHSERGSSSR